MGGELCGQGFEVGGDEGGVIEDAGGAGGESSGVKMRGWSAFNEAVCGRGIMKEYNSKLF